MCDEGFGDSGVWSGCDLGVSLARATDSGPAPPLPSAIQSIQEKTIHFLETTVDPQGRVVLDHLPFRPGEKVEVVIRYDDPFEPVASDDWEMSR